MLPLGQGLFLHLGTGEIHGFGPSGAITGPSNPVPPTNPFHPAVAS